LQGELQAIVEMGLKFAEDITGLPLIMQGQTNQRTPNTLGGMQLQNNNSSTILRRVARNYDDMVTEPHIKRYYDHILEFHTNDDMKAELSIDAVGSTALIERDLRTEGIANLLEPSLNPVFGIDPKKVMKEVVVSNKIDYGNVSYDDEKWQSIVENLQNGPQDPRMAIAEMQAQTSERLKQFEVHMTAVENEKDRALKMGLIEMEREFDIYQQEMGDVTKLSQTQQQAQSSMAETIAKLKTQLAMNRGGEGGGQLINPPTEPAGRAPEGQAYSH